MAQSRNYIVSFNRAEKTSHGSFRVSFDIGKPNVNHAVSADSFKTLEAEVRRLAQAYGQTCSPYVRLADKKERKPAGFDAWYRTLNIIEVEAPVTA